jgi:hypothetical protein
MPTEHKKAVTNASWKPTGASAGYQPCGMLLTPKHQLLAPKCPLHTETA